MFPTEHKMYLYLWHKKSIIFHDAPIQTDSYCYSLYLLCTRILNEVCMKGKRNGNGFCSCWQIERSKSFICRYLSFSNEELDMSAYSKRVHFLFLINSKVSLGYKCLDFRVYNVSKARNTVQSKMNAEVLL